jgi:hypothetical protein
MSTNPPLPSAASAMDGRARARIGMAAARRYLNRYPALPGPDFADADRELEAALRGLADADPIRVEAAFMLGAIRAVDHDTRCAQPCPAPDEVAPIVALLAAGRGANDRARPDQLYPYAMIVDKLYEHTDDPADIDLAITWLSRAATHRRMPPADTHRRMPPADLRRVQMALAVQYANKGADAREAERRTGPGTRSWAAFGAAIGQFKEVLAGLDGRGRRSDTTRNEDKLDALLGLLETYYQRDGEHLPGDDLGVMAVLARELIAGMTSGYRLRGYALGRCGVLLIQGIMHRLGDPWDQALNAAVQSRGSAAIHAAVARVPELNTDLGLAMGALAIALGLEESNSRRQPLLTSAMCAARALRYLVHGYAEDLREFGRLCRMVMGHPDIDPYYRRSCGEFLLVVLARQLRAPAASLAALYSAIPQLSPSGHADLDMMIGLLARFGAAEGLTLDPALSWVQAEAMSMRGGEKLSDTEIASIYARQKAAADTYSKLPAVHAALLSQAAITGMEWARRGSGPAGLAAEVAAAFADALRALPASHPIAVSIAARIAAFDISGRASDVTPPTVAPRPSTDPPAYLSAFNVRTLASLGRAVNGRLAVPAGQAVEIAESMLTRPPHRPIEEAAIRSVLALALYTRWLRERDDRYLVPSIDQLRCAIDLARHEHHLRTRLVELLAAMLLDRAWIRGDHADADAILALLTGLCDGETWSLDSRDLSALLTQSGPTALWGLLTTRPVDHSVRSSGGTGCRIETDAAIGSALLLRALLSSSPAAPLQIGTPQGADDLSHAIELLRRVEAALPVDSVHRPDVLSDLGLALLADDLTRATGTKSGIETLRAAVDACPPMHPHRASILLRTAAAVAANAHAGYVPHLVDQGVDLLHQALQSAGLDAHGERSRCFYGLGYTLLIRFEHVRQDGDLGAAIDALEEARVCLEPTPGDPLMVPLLRLLAWAHRWAAATSRLDLHRSQARSIGRSVLHAQTLSMLLQSGSKHAVAAAGSVSEDALRLTGWCLADGEDESAVEALELGRALVLHAATTAADIPILLREADKPELASEWDSGTWHDVDDVPSDLRHRVLTVLRDDAAEQRLLAAPSIGQIAATLRACRMDALVYLIPTSETIDGCAVIVLADGKAESCRLPDLVTGPGSVVASFTAAYRAKRASVAHADGTDARAAARFRDLLEDMCDWAWTAAIGPLLDYVTTQAPRTPRPVHLVLAPMGILGVVPWQAARRQTSSHLHYACSEALFTTCASARQLIEAAARPRLRVSACSAVLVVNPDERLGRAEDEVDGIHSALYPGAVCLGKRGYAPGSSSEVLACLSGTGHNGSPPSVLHFGCHATAGETPEQSRTKLPGGDLPVSRILDQARIRKPGSPGGLIVLAACTNDLAVTAYDEALTLSSAFLAAGATGVIGARWEVDDLFTALLMFMLHRYLVENPDQGAADALHAAQLWMLDPRREVPAEMPASLTAQARRLAISKPFAWAAFTYHGQ